MDETQEIRDTSKAGDTAVRPAVEDAPEAGGVSETAPTRSLEPKLSDVTGPAKLYLGKVVRHARAGIRAHRVLSLLVFAGLIAGIFALISLGIDAANRPSPSQVEADLAERVSAPTYQAGSFGVPHKMGAAQTEISEIAKPDAETCTVEATCTFSGGPITATETVVATYRRTDKGWVIAGNPVVKATSWTTSEGVDPDQVAAHVDELLSMAEGALQEEGSSDGASSLAVLYADCAATVTSQKFDKDRHRDTVVVHCEKAGAFTSYACDLTATFEFQTATGAWELKTCKASKGAKDLGYDPLKGSWAGAFSTQSADDHRCYGARDVELSLVISEVKVEKGKVSLTGTLSGLAHYHEKIGQDANATSGDKEVKDLAFTGTLRADGSDGGLVFDCTTADDANGSIGLKLTFGLPESPGSARATLTTRHTYQTDFLFIPYEDTATYSDVYSLTKKEG